jgi:alkanesulfonate monooxygenase SsuD/methylene tetrahydromethanopterin reductase-like flavin-dependent oxidoreductase (luciferase family)
VDVGTEVMERIRRAPVGELGADRAGGAEVLAAPVVLRGLSDRGIARAARHGDGWAAGNVSVEHLVEHRERVAAARAAAGRDGHPRTSAQPSDALGDEAEAAVRRSIHDSCVFTPEFAAWSVGEAPADPENASERVRTFAEAGCDELILFPCDPDPAQVDLLADALA